MTTNRTPAGDIGSSGEVLLFPDKKVCLEYPYPSGPSLISLSHRYRTTSQLGLYEQLFQNIKQNKGEYHK